MRRGNAPAIFSTRIAEAREALQARAKEWVDLYDTLIREAIAAQEFEVALKAIQWAQEHMPAGPDGITVLEPSVDRPKGKEGPSGPTVQIGFALGGLTPTQALPPAPAVEVIDLGEPDEEEAIPS